MRLAAYVLVADPTFLRRSLMAYYPAVDRIVLSFDESGRSWTGTPLPLEQCLAIIREIDVEHKCVEAPGRFARLDRAPLDNDTYQRQQALDAASESADWVLQLDTDEVIPRPETFLNSLRQADRAGASALDYPSRWLYSRVRPGRYLEASDRLGRRAASYPGPLAVRAGTHLSHARQTKVPHFRVDIRTRNTDPWHPRTTPVDAVVRVQEAVLHFSWVRTDAVMRKKLRWSGHAPKMDPSADYQRWIWRTRHPHLTSASNLFRRDKWFRLRRVDEPPGGPADEASC